MTTVIIILAIYMLIMLGIGIYAGRKNEGVEDFLLAGRRLASRHFGQPSAPVLAYSAFFLFSVR